MSDFAAQAAQLIERVLDRDAIPPGGVGFGVWSAKHGMLTVTIRPGPPPDADEEER